MPDTTSEVLDNTNILTDLTRVMFRDEAKDDWAYRYFDHGNTDLLLIFSFQKLLSSPPKALFLSVKSNWMDMIGKLGPYSDHQQVLPILGQSSTLKLIR